jgi:hypothetical protein
VSENRVAAAIALLLLDRFQPAEFEQRLPPRLDRRHPDADVVVDMELQVSVELLGHFALASRSRERSDETQQCGAD